MIYNGRAARAALLLVVSAAFSLTAPGARACETAGGGLGVSRVVEIDTASGPLYGDMSNYVREEHFLGPKEVVLTFDDGPMPWITSSILNTLDKFCTKATFFSVGRMAIAYPATVKDVMARGHTLGTHTWSHPFNLPRASLDRAKDEIERGFAAVAMAAGEPIAPFFRFPGLADSNAMLSHLQTRGIAAFTVDVVSNDSYIADPRRLAERTIQQTVARNGGILLFHDIKASTAKALPEILSQLKARGFTVVHMRAKAPLTPVTTYDAALKPMLAKSMAAAGKTKSHLVPFYGVTGPEKISAGAADGTVAASMAVSAASEPPVTELAPAPRSRDSTSRAAGQGRTSTQQVADTSAGETTETLRPRTRKQKQQHRTETPLTIFD